MPINDGGPAFPPHVAEIHGVATNSCEFGLPGMSLRDYFAGQALVCAGPILAAQIGAWTESHHTYIATACYRMADAMLKAREVEPVKGVDPRD